MSSVMKSAFSKTCRLRETGFSLIEFGIVILISGLVMSAAIGLYSNHIKKQKIETTFEQVFSANDLMTAMWNIRGSYPCPADPNLEPTDPKYGKSDCPASSVTPGNCTRPGFNGICVANGVASAELKNSHVLSGMLPFVTIMESYEQQRAELERAYKEETDPATKESLRRTLRSAKTIKFSEAYALSLDGWGNQYTYAVSRAMAGDDTADTADGAAVASSKIKKLVGAVGLRDKLGGQASSARPVHYAIISHGENGLGARTRFGDRKNACDTAVMSDSEVENCDYHLNGNFIRSPVADKGDTENFNDDVVVYNTFVAEDVWEKSKCEGSATDVCLHNKNPGNVIVKSTSVAAGVNQKLTVGGKLAADSILTKALCQQDGTNCFSPSVIGGYRMNRCSQTGLPANKRRVATQLKNGSIDCNKEITLPLYNFTCEALTGITGYSGERKLVKGYDKNGAICADPCKEQTVQQDAACAGSDMQGVVRVEAHYSCTTRTWGPWGEVPPGESCEVQCSPMTETRTQLCPPDHTGSISQQRTTVCPASANTATYPAWTTTSNTCTPAPPECRRFNLTLRSNCNPNEPVQNTVEDCGASYYAVSTSISAVFDSCAPTYSPDAATARASAKSSNCQLLRNGQTHKTSGCP